MTDPQVENNPTQVWVDAWSTDYDGRYCVAMVYATRELAVEAGVDNPQRCTLIDELPEPMRWVKRSESWRDGERFQPNSRTAAVPRHFERGEMEAWRGSSHQVSLTAPFVVYTNCEMWAPDTPENNAKFDSIVEEIDTNPAAAISKMGEPEINSTYTYASNYEKWTVTPPAANTFDAVSDYSRHREPDYSEPS